ncbi:MAG: hypothetical protein ABEJ42_04840, partial [Halobacteriaceae archaeon]
AFLAWEVGTFGRRLRRELGRGAGGERAEAAHLAFVTALVAAVAGLWLGLRAVAPRPPPTVANLLLVAVVVLVAGTALRDALG